MFKIKKVIDKQGNQRYQKIKSNSIDQLINLENLNIQDKIWTNRFAYLLY